MAQATPADGLAIFLRSDPQIDHQATRQAMLERHWARRQPPVRWYARVSEVSPRRRTLIIGPRKHGAWFDIAPAGLMVGSGRRP